jgi:hypothetical protein
LLFQGQVSILRNNIEWTQAATTSFVAETQSLCDTQMSEGTPLYKELGQYNMYSVFQPALPWSDLRALYVCSWLEGRDVQIFLLIALSQTLKSKSAFQINYVSFLSLHYLSFFNAVISVAPTASLFDTKSKGRFGLCVILRKGRIAGSPIEQFVAACCLTTGSKESQELRRMGQCWRFEFSSSGE